MSGIYAFPASAPSMEQSITATALTAVAIPGSGNVLRLVNEGPNLCYIAVGGATVVAVVASSSALATSVPILPGSDVVLSRAPSSETYISAICDTGKTTTLHIASGEGL